MDLVARSGQDAMRHQRNLVPGDMVRLDADDWYARFVWNSRENDPAVSKVVEHFEEGDVAFVVTVDENESLVVVKGGSFGWMLTHGLVIVE